MKIPRLSLSFSKFTDSGLEVKAQSILSSMTDNANFSTPNPSLDTLSNYISTYTEALALAINRDRIQVV